MGARLTLYCSLTLTFLKTRTWCKAWVGSRGDQATESGGATAGRERPHSGKERVGWRHVT